MPLFGFLKFICSFHMLYHEHGILWSQKSRAMQKKNFKSHFEKMGRGFGLGFAQSPSKSLLCPFMDVCVCVCVCVCVAQLYLTLCNSMEFLCPWDSPGKNTEEGCHSLLQGIFLTQESNPGVLHCRKILHLSHQGIIP